ncbi:hypothetical protein QCA50_017922 [Cerrena zonata]|uniref:F-box domain-containing protein n=1 Tax=Cerrena zonata TaxID=2478898 RepID=A0AAW0FJ44_9APHY
MLMAADPIQESILQRQDARSHALSLPELLSPIFEFIPDVEPGRDGWTIKSKFTPFALVCRAWFIPAIRKIWRRSSPGAVVILIPSWKEFIYETEFPTTKYQKHTPEEIDDVVIRNGWREDRRRYDWSLWAKSLRPKDYNRFIFYQQYIITMTNFHSSVPQVIMDAFINAPSSPFQPGISQPFHNLSKIAWNLPMVSPEGWPQEQISLSVLQLVSVHAQQIRSLTLDNIGIILPLAHLRVPLFLSQLVCLEDISLPFSPSPVLAVCLEALSRIKHLSRIVAIHPFNGDNTFNPVLYKGSFPALKTLHIRWSLEDILSFFRLDNAPTGLQTLTMYHGPASTLSSPQVMMDAFREITKRCENIEHFHSSYDHQVWDNFEPDIVTFEMLEPLSRLHRIEEFELTTPFNIGLTDTEVIRLVSRWRGLRLFKLVGSTAGKHWVEPGPTTNMLKLLAQCCPDLHILRLSISFKLADVPRQEPKDHVPLFPALEILETFPGVVQIFDSPPSYGGVHYLVSACPLTCEISCRFPGWVEDNADVDADADVRQVLLWNDRAHLEILRKQRECLVKKVCTLEDIIRQLKPQLRI